MQFYTLPHDSGEVLWYHVSCQCVRPSVCRTFFCPYFLSGGDNLKKCQWSFTKLGVCIDMVEIWFGIVMEKFRQFLKELSARCKSVLFFLFVFLFVFCCCCFFFHFRMIILVNVNGFSPNVVCALIFWRSAFGLLISEFRQLLATRPYFHIWTITLVNINGFSPNLVCALILWTTAFRLLMNEFRPFLTELSARNASVFYFQDNNE